MKMAWQPDQEQLRQLVGYLRDSLSGHDQNAQKYATMVRDKSHSASSLPCSSYSGFPKPKLTALDVYIDAITSQSIARHYKLLNLYLV